MDVIHHEISHYAIQATGNSWRQLDWRGHRGDFHQASNRTSPAGLDGLDDFAALLTASMRAAPVSPRRCDHMALCFSNEG